jgi:hypothetical protein
MSISIPDELICRKAYTDYVKKGTIIKSYVKTQKSLDPYCDIDQVFRERFYDNFNHIFGHCDGFYDRYLENINDRSKDIYETKNARAYHSKKLINYISDFDLYVYGLNEEDTKTKIQTIIKYLIRNQQHSNIYEIYQTSNAVTIQFEPGNEYHTYSVQIIAKRPNDIQSILSQYDLNVSQVAFDGKHLHFSPRAKMELSNKTILLDLQNLYNNRTSGRITKYIKKGFDLHINEDPVTILNILHNFKMFGLEPSDKWCSDDKEKFIEKYYNKSLPEDESFKDHPKYNEIKDIYNQFNITQFFSTFTKKASNHYHDPKLNNKQKLLGILLRFYYEFPIMTNAPKTFQVTNTSNIEYAYLNKFINPDAPAQYNDIDPKSEEDTAVSTYTSTKFTDKNIFRYARNNIILVKKVNKPNELFDSIPNITFDEFFKDYIDHYFASKYKNMNKIRQDLNCLDYQISSMFLRSDFEVNDSNYDKIEEEFRSEFSAISKQYIKDFTKYFQKFNKKLKKEFKESNPHFNVNMPQYKKLKAYWDNPVTTIEPYDNRNIYTQIFIDREEFIDISETIKFIDNIKEKTKEKEEDVQHNPYIKKSKILNDDDRSFT